MKTGSLLSFEVLKNTLEKKKKTWPLAWQASYTKCVLVIVRNASKKWGLAGVGIKAVESIQW